MWILAGDNSVLENNCLEYVLRYMYNTGLPVIPYKLSYGKKIIYKTFSVCVMIFFFALFSFLETTTTLALGILSPIAFAHILQHNLAMIKVFLILYEKKRIWSFTKKFTLDECKPDINRGQVEYRYIEQSSTFAKYHMFTFLGLCGIIFTCLGIYILHIDGTPIESFDPVLNDTIITPLRILPMVTYFPLDITNNFYFFLGWLYQYTSIFFVASYIAAVDALVCGIMSQIKAQYMILRDSLRNYLDRAIRDYNRDSGHNVDVAVYATSDAEKLPLELNIYVRNVITNCVRHHQKIISLCEEAEDVFRYVMLVQILASLLILCFTLLQITMLKIETFAFVSTVFFLFMMTYQIFMYCHCGQQVYTTSDALSNIVYSLNWLPLHPKERRYLLLMMIRSQRPTQLTAGQFVRLSMPTFMSIVKTSASYFTVLNSVRRN